MPNKTNAIKSISIVGLGTLGSEIAKAAAKEGFNLNLIDFDDVEARNIKTQTLYNKEDIGKSKVKIAEKKLKEINSRIKLQTFPEKLTEKNSQLLKSDLVIDCTDNLTARFVINDYCHGNIPFIHTAAFKDLATLYVVLKGKPCLRCIYTSNIDITDCRQSNINPGTAKRVAELTITQIQKLATHQQEENLLRLNIKNNTVDKIKINRRCPRCLKCL